MRRAAFAIAIAWLIQVAQSQELSGTVEGTVMRKGTSEGISGAAIDLCMVPEKKASSPSQVTLPSRDQIGLIRISRSPDAELIPNTLEVLDENGVALISPSSQCKSVGMAVTDDRGHFVIGSVPPGQYALSAQRQGYVAQTPTGGNPEVAVVKITLDSRQSNAEVSLHMVRAATISGRVMDATGKFVANVKVRAMIQRGGAMVLISSRGTDDRGEYRVFGLPPGEYYLAANPTSVLAETQSANSQQAQGASFPLVNDTFYRGAANAADATPVVVKEGEEVSAIDIFLRSR